MKKLQVWDIGARVMLGDVEATVTAVTVRSEHLTYEVVFWSNGTRTCCWVDHIEVVGKSDAPRLSIGFEPGVR